MSIIKSHDIKLKIFKLPIKDIRSSQLYISSEKLRLVQSWFDPENNSNFDPIPVKFYNGNYLMTDGHTRVTAALLAGWETVPCTWDDDPLDMLAYALCDKWCIDEGINNATDLIKRIVPYENYEVLWHKRCREMIVPPSYAAIVACFGGIDGRRNVIILTDNEMIDTACLIQKESILFVKKIDIINLDETDDYTKIYSIEPEDLLILHIGIESWINDHKKIACAFEKPDGIMSKYICIRPTITAQALLDGLNTPYEVTESIVQKYSNLPNKKQVHVTAKSGTDIALTVINPWIIPFNTHEPGANAYLPPAEISYNVVPDTATGTIIVDVTIGELRVNADLINPFGLIDEPCNIHIENGTIINISGGEQAERLKEELWKLPDSCRKLVELGIGLSQMTPTGIIGIDESIAGSCHFGFGNGSGNDAPIHLDVVVKDFEVSHHDTYYTSPDISV